LTRGEHCSGLLVKSLCDLTQILIRSHDFLHGGHAESLLAINVYVLGLELKVDVFGLLFLDSLIYVEVNGQGLVGVNAAQVPVVGPADADFSTRDVLVVFGVF